MQEILREWGREGASSEDVSTVAKTRWQLTHSAPFILKSEAGSIARQNARSWRWCVSLVASKAVDRAACSRRVYRKRGRHKNEQSQLDIIRDVLSRSCGANLPSRAGLAHAGITGVLQIQACAPTGQHDSGLGEENAHHRMLQFCGKY